jgi:hypothetical protein
MLRLRQQAQCLVLGVTCEDLSVAILGVNSSSKRRMRGEDILISEVGEGEQVIHIFCVLDIIFFSS